MPKVTSKLQVPGRDEATRVRFFDQATARQRAREQGPLATPAVGLGWKREELYERGRDR